MAKMGERLSCENDLRLLAGNSIDKGRDCGRADQRI